MSKVVDNLLDVDAVKMSFLKKDGASVELSTKQKEIRDRIIRAEQFLNQHVVLSTTINALSNWYKRNNIEVSNRTIREDINNAKYLFGVALKRHKEYDRFALVEIQTKALVYCLGPLHKGDLPEGVERPVKPDIKGVNMALKNLIVLGAFDRSEPEKLNPDDFKPHILELTTDPAVLGIKNADTQQEIEDLKKHLQKTYNLTPDGEAQVMK